MTQGGTALSVRGAMAIRNLTAGDGPFLVGVMNKDITLTELEQYLEQSAPTFEDDTSNMEIASRGKKIRTLGTLQPQGDGSSASLFLDNVSLRGLRFSEEAAGWSYWLYNLGPTLTTGASLVVAIQTFIRWAQ